MSLVDNFYNLVDRGREGKNHGLSMGLPKMEEYIDGLTQGTSFLLGSGSGTGKTTFVLYSFIYKPLMEKNKERDLYFIYYNLEMTEEQILAKLLSIYLYEEYGVRISFKEMFSRGKNTILSDENYELIKQCQPVLQYFTSRIIFHSGALNSESYRNILNKDLEKFGTFKDYKYTPNNPDQIVGVIIDHMNLIGSYKGSSKKEEMDNISKISVYYRNECKILSPIHVMQLNRNSYGQERLKQGLQEPDESDFKDTGSILEDSMVVLLMYNPVKARVGSHNKYDITKLGSYYRSIKCIKNRFGEADIADGLNFFGDIGIFKELPTPDKICDYEKYKTPDWFLEEDTPEIKEEKEDVKIHTMLTL